MSKHAPATPLPWTLRVHGGDTYIDGNGKLESVACDMNYYPWIETLDMPYIVHAANLYPELLEALKSILEAAYASFPDENGNMMAYEEEAIEKSRAAIAKAEAA